MTVSLKTGNSILFALAIKKIGKIYKISSAIVQMYTLHSALNDKGRDTKENEDKKWKKHNSIVC